MPAMDYERVAGYYDLYARSEIDVPFFLEQAGGCRNVLELTSGTGRLSIPLLEAGVKLACLDSSHAMLEILRGKLQAGGLTAALYEMDVTGFAIPEQFDLIIFPFNTFGEIAEPSHQAAALQSIRRHMAAGGKFICTLHNPAVRLKQVDGSTYLRGRFPLPEGGELALYSTERYDPVTQRVSGAQDYVLTGPNGAVTEKFSMPMSFVLPDRQSFENLLASQEFRILALYGDYACSDFNEAKSPFMIWVLG